MACSFRFGPSQNVYFMSMAIGKFWSFQMSIRCTRWPDLCTSGMRCEANLFQTPPILSVLKYLNPMQIFKLDSVRTQIYSDHKQRKSRSTRFRLLGGYCTYSSSLGVLRSLQTRVLSFLCCDRKWKSKMMSIEWWKQLNNVNMMSIEWCRMMNRMIEWWTKRLNMLTPTNFDGNWWKTHL